MRTRLDESTTSILFILDGLGSLDGTRLEDAGTALVDALVDGTPGATYSMRILDGTH